MRWVRLLVVGMVLSLFAGAFRDAALHPTDVASVVGARAVAALHVRSTALPESSQSVARASLERVVRARRAWAPSLVVTRYAPGRRGVAPPRPDNAPRATPWLARRLFAEHAALLC